MMHHHSRRTTRHRASKHKKHGQRGRGNKRRPRHKNVVNNDFFGEIDQRFDEFIQNFNFLIYDNNIRIKKTTNIFTNVKSENNFFTHQNYVSKHNFFSFPGFAEKEGNQYRLFKGGYDNRKLLSQRSFHTEMFNYGNKTQDELEITFDDLNAVCLKFTKKC